MLMQKIITAVLAAALIGGAAYHFKVLRSNFVIADQGSFMAGGTVLHHTGKYTSPYSPDGQTFHGNHAYVFWQKPFKARKYPLVFIHGIGQFSKTFETTPDGRDGFQNIFLKKRFAVYLVDQARRSKRACAKFPFWSKIFPTKKRWKSLLSKTCSGRT